MDSNLREVSCNKTSLSLSRVRTAALKEENKSSSSQPSNNSRRLERKRQRRAQEEAILANLPLPTFNTDLEALERQFFDKQAKSKVLPTSSTETKPLQLPKFEEPVHTNNNGSDSEDSGFLELKPIFIKSLRKRKLVNKNVQEASASSPGVEAKSLLSSDASCSKSLDSLEKHDLFTLVDNILSTSDLGKVTMKYIMSKLEKHLHSKPNKQQRKSIKEHALHQITLMHAQRSMGSAAANETAIGDKQVVQEGDTSKSNQNHTKAETGAIHKAETTRMENNATDEKPLKNAAAANELPIEEKAQKTEQCSKMESVSNGRKSSNSDHGTVTLSGPLEIDLTSPDRGEKKPNGRRTRHARRDVSNATMQEVMSDWGPRNKRKNGCTICKNCPCAFTSKSDSERAATNLCKSDAAIEATLVQQLLRLERLTERYEDQTDAMRRKLKRHRRDMWTKRQVLLGKVGDPLKRSSRSRFLPDAAELDLQIMRDTKRRKLSKSMVQKAQHNLFSVTTQAQPTLTQMLKGTLAAGECDNESACSHAEQKNNPCENLPAIAEDGENRRDDFNDLTVCNDMEVGVDLDSIASEQDDANSVEDIDDESQATHVPHHRVELNFGRGVVGTEGLSIWESVLSGRYDSLWDSLFALTHCVDNDDGNSGMEHLIEILASSSDQCKELQLTNRIDMTELSQRAQDIAEGIIDHIQSDALRKEELSKACPDWMENVAFALHEQDQASLVEALNQVAASLQNIRRAKGTFLTCVRRQEMVLSFFRSVLRKSIARFDGTTSPKAAHDSCNHETERKEEENDARDGFFFSQLEHPSTPRRESIETVRTIIPSETQGCGPFDTPMTCSSSGSVIIA